MVQLKEPPLALRARAGGEAGLVSLAWCFLVQGAVYGRTVLLKLLSPGLLHLEFISDLVPAEPVPRTRVFCSAAAPEEI